MNAPEKIDQSQIGLYNKFNVTRTDGKDAPGGKHEKDEYFALNLTTDKNVIPALAAYADACNESYPALAQDLRAIVSKKIAADDAYIDVAETTLPNGRVVPAFKVAKYIAGKGYGDRPISTETATPWVDINYFDTKKVCEDAGLSLLTASQAAAIAFQIINQDENWTGGKVGEGEVFKGLHLDTVNEAQSAAYQSEKTEERRWYVLSNGERIHDFSGNVFQWISDDLHGDENGLVGPGGVPADSPLLTIPTAPSMKKGMGWRPNDASHWSGYALVRGGYWRSGSFAGVFYLDRDWPDGGDDSVGVRCTKSS